MADVPLAITATERPAPVPMLRPSVRGTVPVPEARPPGAGFTEPGGVPAILRAAREFGLAAGGLPVIALDPGHGGIDPGAAGVSGMLEKDLVLAFARELRDVLEQTGRYRVILTRDGDVYRRLRDRIAIAQAARAAMLLSLHADSATGSAARGVSVYTLALTASDAPAGRLAMMENRADILARSDERAAEPDVTDLLADLQRRDTANRSIALSEALLDEFDLVNAVERRTPRSAGFAVLRSLDVPSVIVELGYLSEPTDADRLALVHYRARLARAILRAVDRRLDPGTAEIARRR